MSESEYAILSIADDHIFILDVGHKRTRTVTNDAERVVKELYKDFDLRGRRVFYVDSEDRIAEMLHDKNKFLSFKAGHEGVELPHISEWVKNQIMLMDDRELEKVWAFIKSEILLNV